MLARLLPLVLVFACGDAGDGAGDDGGDGGGTDSAGGDGGDGGDSGGKDTGDPIDPFCVDAPTVTWNSFGNGFLKGTCQGCHASTAANRYGAPEAVTFDTVEQAWTWSVPIIVTATGDEPIMPPLGGVSADDRLLLEYWLRCAEFGT